MERGEPPGSLRSGRPPSSLIVQRNVLNGYKKYIYFFCLRWELRQKSCLKNIHKMSFPKINPSQPFLRPHLTNRLVPVRSKVSKAPAGCPLVFHPECGNVRDGNIETTPRTGRNTNCDPMWLMPLSSRIAWNNV